jgi:hypothetical protein
MRRGTGVSPATYIGTRIERLENRLWYILDASKVGLGDATNTSRYTITGYPSQGISDSKWGTLANGIEVPVSGHVHNRPLSHFRLPPIGAPA